ncbi:hypothetical protein ACVBEQ_12775 [Nakamurella sp. GG22]
MTDLEKQLRGYGRQIENDLGAGASEGSAPAQVTRLEAPPWSKSGSRRSSGRSAWVAVAAATAAVSVTASLLLGPTTPEEGSMNNKTSGAAVGICLFAAGCTSGAQGADTSATVAGQPAAPTSAVSSSQSSTGGLPGLFDEAGEVTPGTYQVDLVGTPVQITVPAGWSRFEDFALEGPDSSYFAFFDVEDTYKDGCNWDKGKAGIGPTVDDLVTGLQAEKGLKTSAPEPLTVDGFTGRQLITTTDPAIKDFSSYYLGDFAVWTVVPNRQIGKQQPGEKTTTWILDLDGRRGVITTGSPGSMTDATRTQVQGMLSSLKLG